VQERFPVEAARATMAPMHVVHLIDASPYLFRAFFSIPRSVPQNAVYGFKQFLQHYITDAKPTHIAVAFDRHFNGSFRNDYYPAYKAHREASPPELDAQVDPCLELVQSLGVATFIDERYEADDIIATIIDRTRSSGAHFVIVSSDKDLTQLVCDKVTLIEPARKLLFDEAAVVAKFGVRPEQITDFLGLAGDAVDNIPGVKGIGAKTAALLLKKYGSIEGIYEHVGEMAPNAIRANLERDVSNAGLSKRLATVSTEAPIGKVTIGDLKYRGDHAS
jgi:DNA polymerase I